VTAVAYQRALCDMIASPGLCLEVRRCPDTALAPYDLTARERRRLEAIVRQPGMSVSCTLYRVNRLTPLATLLPMTCRLLGDRFVGVAERFWARRGTDLQFRTETERFCDHLARELREGLNDRYLTEVVEFEIAANRLRFLPRDRSEHDSPSDVGLRIHPKVAVTVFTHDPTLLLGALAEDRDPPQDLPDGRFPILLDVRSGDLELIPLRPDLEAAIRRVEEGTPAGTPFEEELHRAGLLIRSEEAGINGPSQGSRRGVP
jgi:hypothetical protein